MRICVSGPQCVGKTTFIKDFLSVWPGYKTTDKTYRDIIVDEELNHSSSTTEYTQNKILQWMVDEQKKYKKTDKIIFDRGPLDNLVYTMWATGAGLVSEDFFKYTVELVRESMKNIDVIFLILMDGNIPLVDDKLRDVDKLYQQDINDLFLFVYDQYVNNFKSDVFFPLNDSPGIIVISGSREQRISTVKDYIDDSGDLYGEEQSILSPDQLYMFETLLSEQREALEKEVKKQKTSP